MAPETIQVELALLRSEQRKAREDEVFGGWSAEERVAYTERQDRIQELERELQRDKRRKQWVA